MSMSGHRSRKHGVNSRGEVVPKKMFPCGHCGKLLTSKMKLQCVSNVLGHTDDHTDRMSSVTVKVAMMSGKKF